MEKTNHFSRRYASKSTEELRQITESKEYSEEARLAAIWELEKRGEADEKQINKGDELQSKKITFARRRYELNKYNTF